MTPNHAYARSISVGLLTGEDSANDDAVAFAPLQHAPCSYAQSKDRRMKPGELPNVALRRRFGVCVLQRSLSSRRRAPATETREPLSSSSASSRASISSPVVGARSDSFAMNARWPSSLLCEFRGHLRGKVADGKTR